MRGTSGGAAKLLLGTFDEGSCYKKDTEKFKDMNELVDLVAKGQRKPEFEPEPADEAGAGAGEVETVYNSRFVV